MLRRWERDSGQELVEFALVFPLLLLLLLGVIGFGQMIYSYSAISNAAREAARYAVVPSPGHQDQIQNVTETCPGSNPIIQVACDRALALDQGGMQVTLSAPLGGASVRVEVEYNGDYMSNVLLRALNRPALSLRTAATMRLE
jgi:Flp pilus assembly protein TadG